MKHHLGGEKAVLGFGTVQFRTLVSVAIDSSYRVIMGGNSVSTFSRLFFIQSFLYLHGTRKVINSQTSSKFGQIRPPTAELAALECLKKPP